MAMTFQETLDTLVYDPTEISTILDGNQGIGKTACVRIANQKRSELYKVPHTLIELRLSQCELGDMIGMSFQVNGRTVNAPPEWFPIDNNGKNLLKLLFHLTEDIATGQYGEHGILFLDELNRCLMDVEQCSFQMIEMRQLKGWKMPEGWKIVAAMNGNTKIYKVRTLESALMSRLQYILFAPTIKEWEQNAIASNYHPSIIRFHQNTIAGSRNYLDPSDEDLTNNLGKKIYDRRAWEKLSICLNHYESLYKEGKWGSDPVNRHDTDWLYKKAQAFVGDDAARVYISFIKTEYDKEFTVEEILRNWNTKIEKYFKGIVADGGKGVELTTYFNKIIDYCKNPLNDSESYNLLQFFEILPNEYRMRFWKSFISTKESIANAWYDHPIYGKEISKLVLSTMTQLKKLK